MRLKIAVLFVLVFVGIRLYAQKEQVKPIPVPTPAQLEWQDAEIAAVFHYDLHVFDGKRYDQNYNRITPIPDINIFNPTHLNTDQWIRTAKSAGAKIAILTATHETGFALYQSDVNHYCMKALKYKDGKGDIVRDFVNSCRKYGVKPGIYIGIRWNSYLGVHDFMMPKDGTTFSANRQAYYNRMCEGMTRELMSRYGDLAIVWYDGGGHGPELGGPDVLPIVEKYQKSIIFYHNTQRADIRWGGSESGTVPYPCWGTYPFPYSHSTNQDVVFKDDFKLLKHGDPNGEYYKPAMSDTPLHGYGSHEWFWEPNDESHILPLGSMIDMYVKSAGRNSTLIIGLTPDERGLMPGKDSVRLAEFGDSLRKRFDNPIARVTYVSARRPTMLKLPYPTRVHDIVLQEDIRRGERVRHYIIEGKTDGRWILLDEGSCIGHKHIIPLQGAKVSAIRLKILSALEGFCIKEMAVY